MLLARLNIGSIPKRTVNSFRLIRQGLLPRNRRRVADASVQ
jgi:hypothetical protein